MHKPALLHEIFLYHNRKTIHMYVAKHSRGKTFAVHIKKENSQGKLSKLFDVKNSQLSKNRKNHDSFPPQMFCCIQ